MRWKGCMRLSSDKKYRAIYTDPPWSSGSSPVSRLQQRSSNLLRDIFDCGLAFSTRDHGSNQILAMPNACKRHTAEMHEDKQQ